MASIATPHDPYRALRYRDFQYFLAGRLLAAMAVLMQDVAVGWQLYERTHSPLALGLTGLAAVSPTLLFFLPSGTVADRYDRRNVVRIGRVVAGVMSAGLAVLSYTNGPIWMIYLALFVGGIGYAFVAPAQSALLSQVLPPEAFANGVTWGARRSRSRRSRDPRSPAGSSRSPARRRSYTRRARRWRGRT